MVEWLAVPGAADEGAHHVSRTATKVNAALGGTVLLTLIVGVSVAGSSSGSDGHTSDAGPAAAATPEGDSTKATLLGSGFGQADRYVWVTSIVRNDSTASGQTVIVHFNLKDDSGALVASADQTEAFSRPGQQLVLGTQATIPDGKKAASVEATLDVKYPGIGSPDPFPEITTGPVMVTKGEFRGYEAQAELKNPTAQPLRSSRVGVVCYDETGRIDGGSSAFPELVPAGGSTIVKTLDLIVSGIPARCAMRAGPGLVGMR